MQKKGGASASVGPVGEAPKQYPKYTLRNPVPIRSDEDLSRTRAGIPTDATLALVSSGPVDHDSLAKAIRRSVGHDGMRPDDARAIAAHVLNFFGFNQRIIDNVLEPDDRDTFYMLEDTGILETERDETTLYDGREWRIHYWMFRKDRIFDLAREETQAMAEAGEADIVYSAGSARSGAFRLPHGETGTGLPAHAVYHELGDEVWLERRSPGHPGGVRPPPPPGHPRAARKASGE
ncbi:MAG TPA: DUF6015 family protein [Thermoplasmata archaeon]|nr:DUF6015 family protein [Thermoplasmata archaeon]